MTAATKGRDTRRVSGDLRNLPVAAATKLFAGTMIQCDASGNATKNQLSTAIVTAGVVDRDVDNSAGAAGDKRVNLSLGVFGPFANSAAADAIGNKNVGQTCYYVDDSTVALTNGSNTRGVAGVIHAVDADGVWVRFV